MEETPIVKSFAARGGKSWLQYRDDGELDDIVRELREKRVESKHVLILKEFRGRFFQKCPGSPGMICCNYLVLNTCFNCLFDCAYCFLNGYLNSYGIMQFTNTEVLSDELRRFMDASDPEMVYRVGTGEFTDSMMFDEVTGIAAGLIAETAQRRNIMLELKTKSDNIGHLLDIREKGNTVLSWTLGPERNIAGYERGTANLEQRLAAAGKASERGYLTAFHFDPVIIYDGWESDYDDLLDKLFRTVDPSGIPWISIGGFRYASGFKEILRRTEAGGELVLAEMFPGSDGKFRYFRPLRTAMYKYLLDRMARYAPKTFIYLCMESAAVWREVFGRDYSSSGDLERDFSDSMRKFLGLDTQ